MIGRWIHQFIIASCRLKQPSIELRRTLTSRRAAVLLRPFYFAVHPDRFADNKLAKEQNEKSLKVFNGYLNELFPGSRYQKPVDLPFFIQNKDGQVKEVVLSLSGSNVMSIIKYVR
ncbi:hypothetical protein AB6A40_011236 [Gnathostoma spinigerum]|uniref:DUF4460 domain-containing protein n=1 Tax=Gnathostoma spinigerum TaxID=75299 RepID=A0ABD6F3S9_9BILA